MPAKAVQHRINGNTTDARDRNGNGLGRKHVAEIQRKRLLAAMTEVVCEHGASKVTVAHVVERAGVSRRTFYEIFDDIEDCLLAAIEDALGSGARRVTDAYDANARWIDRVRASLGALLRFLEDDPAAGRLLLVESLAAGPRALHRRNEMLAPLVQAVDAGREEVRKGVEPPPLTAEGVVGGVLGVLHSRLSQQSPGPLSELVGPLMSMIALPYLGAAAAKRELARPTPKPAPTVKVTSANLLNQLHMRLTYRTIRVLGALATSPGSSNRRVADAAGISDQGQVSKLLARLRQLGLIENASSGAPVRGEPNAWTLTSKGWEVQRGLVQQISES